MMVSITHFALLRIVAALVMAFAILIYLVKKDVMKTVVIVLVTFLMTVSIIAYAMCQNHVMLEMGFATKKNQIFFVGSKMGLAMEKKIILEKTVTLMEEIVVCVSFLMTVSIIAYAMCKPRVGLEMATATDDGDTILMYVI